MAIKGLTDRDARWPRLGTLRKGAAKPTKGNRPGADLGERFRFDAMDDAAQTQWRRIFGGDEVDELEILLPYQDLSACWDAWREEWTASSLVRRCDGETITAWADGKGGFSHEPKPCPKRADGSCACNTKPTGRLTFTVPAFARMGTITLTTTSIHDIMAIDGTLKALAATVGDLRLVPLRLSRIEREISTPTKEGGRARRSKWLVNLEAHPDWVERQLAHQKTLALSSASDFTALPAPEEDDDAPVHVNSETGEVLPLGATVNGHADYVDGEVVETDATEEPHFSERIEAASSTIEALIIADEIIDQLPENAHRCNALGKAFMRAVDLAETKEHMSDVRGSYKKLGGALGRHQATVVEAVKIRLAEITGGESEPAEATEAEAAAD